MRHLGVLFRWEFNKLGRFPLPEIIVGIATLAIVQPLQLTVSFSRVPEEVRGLAEDLAIIYVGAGLASVQQGFLILGALAAALVSLVFSQEMETAGLRGLFALPLRKGDIFFGKVASMFLILSLVVSAIAILYALFLDPLAWFSGRLSWLYLLLLPLGVSLLIFTLTSFGVLAAILTGRTVIAIVTAFGLVFGLGLLSEAVTVIDFLPVLLPKLTSLLEPDPSGRLWLSLGINALMAVLPLSVAYVWFVKKTEA
ncbi:MAG: hypothetical protein ACE5IJ_04870 [Thermoplasmata archaeon]